MPHRLRQARVALALAALLAAVSARPEDLDGDGLDDGQEDALLQRFAPLVLLHPSEAARPGSAEWLLARADVEPAPGRAPRVLAASIVGAFGSPSGRAQDPSARLHPRSETHAGSPDPRTWIAYGHAFRGDGGGIVLQYWFFYPFNDGYWVFDHEGDWEHVAVKLDAALRPEGAWYARHRDSHPGVWFAWGALVREGEHPVVLAARGTHASYAGPDDAPFWERLCPETDPARAVEKGCAAWRTWHAPGGVAGLGERSAPRVAFLSWPGRWGSTGRFGLDSRTFPPPGPAFQVGWCSGAAAGACP
jgi:hypothetical protein